MNIQEQVRQELKDAMRAKDQMRLDVLRQIETEVAKAKSAPDFVGEVGDVLYEKMIAGYAKRMQKALKEYKSLGDRAAEMIEKLT